MIIKSFTAATAAAALKLIREEMGSDAVILRTRLSGTEPGNPAGKRVEVTACIDEAAARKPVAARSMAEIVADNDEPPVVTTQSAAPRRTTADLGSRLDKTLNFMLQAQRSPVTPYDCDPGLLPAFLELVDADVPLDIARQYVMDAERQLSTGAVPADVIRRVVGDDLRAGIASDIDFRPGLTVAFVGSSGSGKTSALAKLAADLTVTMRKKVKLASLDDRKISAYEEIGGYADILEIPLEAAGRISSRRDDDAVLLVDTPSIPLSPSASEPDFAQMVHHLHPDVIFLVFSVATRANDLIDAVTTFDSIRPTHLLASHLDEVARWGGITAMTKYLDIPLAYITDAPGGVGRLHIPDPGLIAARLLNSRGGQNE
ncbi:MAG: hypothetical protein JW763_08555 [candidate division Zixibacteria bacterium]|nr:hypothetical protein [candidate division Zixibacteria bacterium]